MITTPHTYYEWIAVFDELKKRSVDREILDVMRKGTIEWQPGIAERFSERLMSIINYRINRASDQFQKELNYGKNQESVIIQALLGLRKELQFLAEISDLPVLPKSEREQLHQLVIDQSNAIQRSLEDSAKKDRSGKLGYIVRNHKITVQ